MNRCSKWWLDLKQGAVRSGSGATIIDGDDEIKVKLGCIKVFFSPHLHGFFLLFY